MASPTRSQDSAQTASSPSSSSRHVRSQQAIGAGALVLGAVLAFGASGIPAEAGYAGIGPNFLPWLVCCALLGCGAWLLWEASSGGFRVLEDGSGAARGDWLSLAWVAAGVLACAALLTTLGFVLANTLCFMLSVRGLRRAEGKPNAGLRRLVLDFVTGVLIAAPAFWLFTKLLGINLPGLTGSGWL